MRGVKNRLSKSKSGKNGKAAKKPGRGSAGKEKSKAFAGTAEVKPPVSLAAAPSVPIAPIEDDDDDLPINQSGSVPLPASMPDGEMITAEELCFLTGFSDSWHRKVAGRGYYPPPIRGQYFRTAAIRGLFQFQRELVEQSKKNLAKKHEVMLDKKIEDLAIDIATKKRQVLPLSEISDKLRAISEEQKSALSFQLMDHLPAVNAGQSALVQRRNNRIAFLAICDRFQAFAKKFLPNSTTDQPSTSTTTDAPHDLPGLA